MTRCLMSLLFVTGITFAGCDSTKTPPQGPAPAFSPTDPPPGGGAPIGVTAPAADSTTDAAAPAVGGAAAGTAAAPVPVSNGVATLTPENTRIEFIGTHVGPTPDPNARTGTFTNFSGTLNVDPAAKAVTGITMDIKTESLTTAMEKLTAHLHSEDFLDVREFPSLTFQSTEVKPGAAAGNVEITGDLTLHGVTKQVTIPGTATVDDQGVTLSTEFTIDRSDYGMDKVVDKVEKVVTLTVKVGETNVVPAPVAPPGQ